jgi:hypothetical protein
VNEIEYTLVDSLGKPVRAVTRLTDNSASATDVYDSSPVVAVDADGHIGVAWYRYLYDRTTGQYNYNIYFAILDASGGVVVSATNLTGNTSWGTWGGLNWPSMSSARVAAAGNDRFVLAWARSHQEGAGSVSDIYYAVRDTSGGEIKAVTKLTGATAGLPGYRYPAIAGLSSSRVFLSWYDNANNAIYYVIVDSDGSLFRSSTNLSTGAALTQWGNHDAVQLSDGKVLAAWQAWGCFGDEWKGRIVYAILD